MPDFKAKKPFIHVSIVKDKNGAYKTDWDVQTCESFIKEFGKWSKCNPGLELPV
ncbi:putative Ycf34 [Prochlorococcus marinus str. MIT 9311]|nr:putative Ycf34 [Prochlorococcus marinus str. MIT 9311]